MQIIALIGFGLEMDLIALDYILTHNTSDLVLNFDYTILQLTWT